MKEKVVASFILFCKMNNVPYRNVPDEDLTAYVVTILEYLNIAETNPDYLKFFDKGTDERVLTLLLHPSGVSKMKFYVALASAFDL